MARTPHEASTATTRRGTGPPQVLAAQGAMGHSRRVGPIRSAYDAERITMRGTGGEAECEAEGEVEAEATR